MRIFLAFLVDQRGATAIEYGLLIGILAVSLFIALGLYYDAMVRMFDYILAKISG